MRLYFTGRTTRKDLISIVTGFSNLGLIVYQNSDTASVNENANILWYAVQGSLVECLTMMLQLLEHKEEAEYILSYRICVEETL